MPGEQNDTNDQDARTGGYGGSRGGQDPAGDQAGQGDNTSATGRENPVTDPIDADEAMGNRTGAYGYPTKDVDSGDAGGEP